MTPELLAGRKRTMQAELTGILVHLRPLRRADLQKRAGWTADDELLSLMGVDPAGDPFVSPEDEERRNVIWLHERQRAGDQLYAIEANGRYVGDIDVEFFPQAHKAEITVFIGDRSAWGKGYGTESVCLVLNALGAEPGVGRVEVDVAKGNDASFGFWRKLGFEEFRTDHDGTRWLSRSIGSKRTL
jgi:RimJ/RimL family protein N-acetyltransferase